MNPVLTLLIAILIIALDQASKWAVMDLLQQGPVEIWPFFNLIIVWNKGVSFGLFGDESDLRRYILIAVAFIITAIFVVWAFRTKILTQHIGIALVIGGAIGNVIDRFRFGAVFDFLDFHVAGYHWPAFNVADSAICVGVAVLMIYAFFFEKPLHRTAEI